MIDKMRALLKFLVLLLVLCAVVYTGAWFWAGRAAGPTIEIRQPGKFVGQANNLELMVDSPGGQFSRVDVTLEQNGKTYPIFSLDQQGEATVRQESADRLYIMRPVGKRAVPELQAGAARIVVRAARPVVYGIRDAESEVSHDVQVRLERPQVAVLSSFHYINHGGTEFVVYRATPADVQSGVRVGDKEYPGFAASRRRHQRRSGAAGRVLRAALRPGPERADERLRPRRSRQRGAHAARSHGVPEGLLTQAASRSTTAFSRGSSRRLPTARPTKTCRPTTCCRGFSGSTVSCGARTTSTSRDLAKKTSPDLQFRDVFQQLGNSQVEAKFADTRTYMYKGKEVDKQVHLGFDLAVTANVPLVAAQRGTILHASDLGIYGNCVVIDHGMGVMSLYGHLSSIGVNVGDTVDKGRQIGRSGMTGLAGGDHLHFTMLVGGEQVTPVDWWSAQWFQDRVLRKIMQAGGSIG